MILAKNSRSTALLASGMWLVVVYPLLNGFGRDFMPAKALSNGGDFSSYYSGTLSVKLWQPDTLYPTPIPDVYQSPPDFRPAIQNPWFDDSAGSDARRLGDWSFYPQVATPSGSDVSETLVEICPTLQGDCRYIYPPPLAFLLYPLSLFNYDTACKLWFFLMSASLFGIGLLGSRVCSILFGRETWVGAAALLLPALPTMLFSETATALTIGNVSPMLGFLITLCAYGFLTNKQVAIGLSTIPLLLFKGIGLAWCPMLLIGKWKWKAILVMGLLTILLNGLALWYGGPDIYSVFFKEILPKTSLPLGTGLAGVVMNLLGVNLEPLLRTTSLLLAIGFLVLHYLSVRAGTDLGRSSLSSLVGMMAVFNLLNPVIWPHYFTSYLILPFFPWIAHEITKIQGKTKVALTFVFLSVVVCWLDSILLSRDSWAVGFLRSVDLYPSSLDFVRKCLSGVAIYAIPFVVTSATLALAIRSLFRMNGGAEGSIRGSVPSSDLTQKYHSLGPNEKRRS